MSEIFDPTRPLNPAFRSAVAAELSAFIDARAGALADMGPELAELQKMAASFCAGGKRLRPAFCAWGYLAAAPEPADPTALVRVAASLDVLHVSALVHDDVMDDSDTRRGVPSAHLQFAAQHRARSGRGDAASFGLAGAILLGDLLTMWSAQLFNESGFSPDELGRARPVLDAMRSEVTCGQYLDMYAQTHSPSRDEALDEAARVVEFKSARYTVTRPMQIGAALAGAGDDVLAALLAAGSPLGRAFQYRDDVLGVFGEPTITGKPSGDDIRDGKRTVLIAHAFAKLDAPGRQRLDSLLGRADLSDAELDDARELIVGSGARETVEQEIEDALAETLRALDAAPLSELGREGLSRLADQAVRRDS